MAWISSFLSSALFSIILFSCYCPKTHGEEFFTFSVASLLPSSTCTPLATLTLGPNSLEIINQNGPCSGNPIRKHTQLSALSEDILRVASINDLVSGERFKQNSTLSGNLLSLQARSGLYLGSGNYVISLSLGTPARTQTLIFDTGSSVNWVQCRPCSVTCYPQAEPIFDPSLSSSYRTVPCSSSACAGLSRRGCSSAGTCIYQVLYGDGSSTTGFLSTETLTLTPALVYPNFVFGCGQNNQGLFRGAAGLLGLDRSSYSLNSQLSASLGRVFSYCLPSTNSLTGYLNLGSPVNPTTNYTSILSDSRAPSLYFVDLIGLSVGSLRLSIDPAVFRSVGTIIDSGTVITRLPSLAYAALRAAFQAGMVQYVRAPAVSLLDTCYYFSSLATVRSPAVTLHFAGADVVLPPAAVFYAASPSRFCLAFAGNTASGQIGIIGNVQQKTFEVIHDVPGSRIGFAANACG